MISFSRLLGALVVGAVALCVVPVAHAQTYVPLADSIQFDQGITGVFRLPQHVLVTGNGVARVRSRDTVSSTFPKDVDDLSLITTTPFADVVGRGDSLQPTIETPGKGIVAYRAGELIALQADGTETDRWRIDATGGVRGMRLSGDTLFLYGPFSQVAGQSRRGAAAVRMSQRAVLAFDPQLVGAYAEPVRIRDLQVYSDRVFVDAPNLAFAGGAAQTKYAMLRRSDGAVLPWTPTLSDGSSLPLDIAYASRLGVSGCNQGVLRCFLFDAYTGAYVREADVPGNSYYANAKILVHEGVLLVHGRGYGMFVDGRGQVSGSYGSLNYRNLPVYVGERCVVFEASFSGTPTGYSILCSPGYVEQTYTVAMGDQDPYILGNQLYGSDQNNRVVFSTSALSGNSVLLNVATSRVDTTSGFRFCGRVNNGDVGHGWVYLNGTVRLQSDGVCAGQSYGPLLRLNAATGSPDAGFAPVLFGADAPPVAFRAKATAAGVLVGAQGHLYQPDITQPRPGALARYGENGERIGPAYRVLRQSGETPSVQHMATLGDSLVAIAGVFDTAGSVQRGGLAVLRIATGEALPLIGEEAYTSTQRISGLALTPGILYLSGPSQIRRYRFDGSRETVCSNLFDRPVVLGEVGNRLLVREDYGDASDRGDFLLNVSDCSRERLLVAGQVVSEISDAYTYDGAALWKGEFSLYKYLLPSVVTSEEEALPVEPVEALRLWPNPARSVLRGQLPAGVRGGTVVVADLLGREVLRHALAPSEASFSLAVEGLSSGIYVVQVHNDAGKLVARSRFVTMR